MTQAKYRGEVVEVISVEWGEKWFNHLKEQFPNALVSVRKGNQLFTARFRDLEWVPNE